MTTQSPQPAADAQSWALLAALSLVWGGSFLFIGVAVKELPPLVIVMARVCLAAMILLPLHFTLQGKLPRDAKTWLACGGMSVMNNVIPFSLITWGQQHITAGLASVINATTPMFAVAFLALAGLEAMDGRKLIGILLGVIGVVVLKGGNFGDFGPQSLGIIAVIIASSFYGLSSPWSKVRLKGIPPLTTATCQLTLSSLMMIPIAGLFSQPEALLQASGKAWLSLALLAAVSTSLAYLLFFRIIARAGPAFASLVTMIIPLSAIVLGAVFLGESLSWHEVIGGLVIGLALLVIDGRFLLKASGRASTR